MTTEKISNKDMLFCDYYKQWINIYKEGAIRPVTMNKYNMAYKWLLDLVPDLKIRNLDRITYQKLLNDYADKHERQTTMDFHHHLKCAVLDAVDEGLISRDPTRKAIIKGKQPRSKKLKYLNQYELHKMIDDLNLGTEINTDCRLASPLAYTCNSTELYVKSKIAKTIHKYGDTILMCFNVSFLLVRGRDLQ